MLVYNNLEPVWQITSAHVSRFQFGRMPRDEPKLKNLYYSHIFFRVCIRLQPVEIHWNFLFPTWAIFTFICMITT